MKFQLLMKTEMLFLQTVYAIEKLLAGLNVISRISMNLYYNAKLLMSSHGYIQHPASVKAFGYFLCLNHGMYDTITSNTVYILFLIKSN